MEGLVGSRLKESLEVGPKKEHRMIVNPNGERQRCVYCVVTDQIRRTRFICEACEVPYCSIGAGSKRMDCFALAHETENIRQICLNKYKRGQSCTRKRILKKR